MSVNVITVNANQVALPNGQVYNSGAVAVLSDEEFAKVSPLAFTGTGYGTNGASPMLTITSEDGITPVTYS